MRISVYHNIALDGHYRPGHPVVHVLDAELGPADVGDPTAEQLAEQVFTACDLAPDWLTGGCGPSRPPTATGGCAGPGLVT